MTSSAVEWMKTSKTEALLHHLSAQRESMREVESKDYFSTMLCHKKQMQVQSCPDVEKACRQVLLMMYLS